jgi:hypothetical protein
MTLLLPTVVFPMAWACEWVEVEMEWEVEGWEERKGMMEMRTKRSLRRR